MLPRGSWYPMFRSYCTTTYLTYYYVIRLAYCTLLSCRLSLNVFYGQYVFCTYYCPEKLLNSVADALLIGPGSVCT